MVAANGLLVTPVAGSVDPMAFCVTPSNSVK
jgi:hypothetical protein